MSSNLVVIHDKLNRFLEEKKNALPKDFNQTRFLQNCMTVLQDVKDINKMEPISVARTMLKGAFLGLDFFNKECYAIPYGQSLQFQTDYKGEKKIIKKHSINPVLDIYAKLVREGDDFEEEIIQGRQTINFKPKSFNDGKIVGAFAAVIFKDGSMMYEAMSVNEIEAIRDKFSKQPKGKAWTDSFGEMAKKTVLRRLCKHIEIDFETTEQAKTFEEASDFEMKETITATAQFTEPKRKSETEAKPTEPTPEEQEEMEKQIAEESK